MTNTKDFFNFDPWLLSDFVGNSFIDKYNTISIKTLAVYEFKYWNIFNTN